MPPWREHLVWVVEWMGMVAGHAEATVAPADEGVRIELTSRSTGLVQALYPIDDRAVSSWLPGTGSTAYDTRFREGRFVQDQAMLLRPPEVRVARRQHVDGAWRDSTQVTPVDGWLEDPVSAVWRLRSAPLDADLRFAVWTGREVKVLHARVTPGATVGGRAAVRLEIDEASHAVEDVRGRITLWLADDAARTPLRAEVRTRAGTVSARLVDGT